MRYSKANGTKEMNQLICWLGKVARRVAALGMAVLCLCSSMAYAASYSKLEFGSSGSDVLKMQQALITLGFNPGGADGKYGRGTESAVRAFQASRKLVVDGIAGNLTLTALYAELEAQNQDSGSSAQQGSLSSGTLKYGDAGSKVTELQKALTKLGYNTNGIDGRFGAGTQRAVIAFQKDHKLTADGLAGSKTLELLYALANNAGSVPSASISTGLTRILRKGCTGSDVKAVQEKLRELGYYSGAIDGVYGSGSVAAAQAFQLRNGLQADGAVGQLTYQKLFSSSAKSAGADAPPSATPSPPSTANDPNTYVTLRPGDTGDAVRKLQKALADLKYTVGVDGSYGNITRDAVIAFQKQNSLTADGIAGALTQTILYSGNAKAANSTASPPTSPGNNGLPTVSGPSSSEVKLLHWYNVVKPSIRTGQDIIVYDPATSLQWTLRLYSLGHHADSEPKTLADTQAMFQAFGYQNTWTPKPVFVKLPSGVWTLASMHNVPHLTGSIKDNGFDGHLCVHFLRDMDECMQNDPDYGVTNQNVIRKKWKEMTGQVVE